ncbi:MAG: Rrf2 family transcriptional regulator [Elusimicrobia bacterium]|nr:Rrf2 family transcriptional regulator [Elusimicrobiota bacterium]
MLKLSKRSSYGVRAVFSLARFAGDHPTKSSEVAKREQIPLRYLEQIFHRLRQAGIIQAIRGPHGGYTLTKTPAEIRVGDIVRALEGKMEPVLCSIPENRSEECHEVEGCVSRVLCNQLDGEVNHILNSITLADFCHEAEHLAKLRAGSSVIC